MLYVGIAPKRPYQDGRRSQTTLGAPARPRCINGSGITIEAMSRVPRLTLGCLLSEALGIELRRVRSGRRRTFSAGEHALSEWMAGNAFVHWLSRPRRRRWPAPPRLRTEERARAARPRAGAASSPPKGGAAYQRRLGSCPGTSMRRIHSRVLRCVRGSHAGVAVAKPTDRKCTVHDRLQRWGSLQRTQPSKPAFPPRAGRTSDDQQGFSRRRPGPRSRRVRRRRAPAETPRLWSGEPVRRRPRRARARPRAASPRVWAAPGLRPRRSAVAPPPSDRSSRTRRWPRHRRRTGRRWAVASKAAVPISPPAPSKTTSIPAPPTASSARSGQPASE